MASILATVGAGIAASRWAWRQIKLRNHPYAADHAKIGYQYEEYRRRGVMDSATAYLGLTKLRFWKKIYGPVFPALRDPIVRTTTETPAREKSLQGFEVDMTRDEARNVLGMTQAETQDAKIVQKKFRRLMLKNHPDIGGSAYLASKINEAKEILTGEKVPKGENEKPREEQDNPDETPEEAEKRAEREKKKREGVKVFGWKPPKGSRILEREGESWKSYAWYKLTKGKIKMRKKIKDML